MKEELQDPKIAEKIGEIAAIADQLPGVVIIHDLKDMSVLYMSPRGKEILGVTMEELIQMGPDYHKAFFNPDESADYVPKVMDLLERNTDEWISLFQQVRRSAEVDWTWYLTSLKIFMRNETGKPLLVITLAVPIDPAHHVTIKMAKLLEENNFLRKNYHRYSGLTKREREILQFMVFGKTSPEIARELFISTATVETHRRNIKSKLDASSSFELSQYARAFNLV